MGKKKQHAEHDGSERWLLTYSDLITLLLGLFVILYASSQVDAKKFQAVMAAFGSVFEGGGAGLLPGANGALETPIQKGPGQGEGQGGGMDKAVKQQVRDAIREAVQAGQINLSETTAGLTVHVTEKLLFDPGADSLRPEAVPVLESLGKTLAGMKNEIRIEGHTDDRPISTPAFPTNWHLSTARALNVAVYLLDHSAIDPKRVAVVGYGEYRPIAPNDSEADRAINRRVDIVVVK